ncbi:Rha family transcriptional regulator [Paenibacillus larvae]
MKQLNVINQNGQLLVDSREVAMMTGKQHKDLLENIRGYIKHLLSGNYRPVDFFIEDASKEKNGGVTNDKFPHRNLVRPRYSFCGERGR